MERILKSIEDLGVFVDRQHQETTQVLNRQWKETKDRLKFMEASVRRSSQTLTSTPTHTAFQTPPPTPPQTPAAKRSSNGKPDGTRRKRGRPTNAERDRRLAFEEDKRRRHEQLIQDILKTKPTPQTPSKPQQSNGGDNKGRVLTLNPKATTASTTPTVPLSSPLTNGQSPPAQYKIVPDPEEVRRQKIAQAILSPRVVDEPVELPDYDDYESDDYYLPAALPVEDTGNVPPTPPKKIKEELRGDQEICLFCRKAYKKCGMARHADRCWKLQGGKPKWWVDCTFPGCSYGSPKSRYTPQYFRNHLKRQHDIVDEAAVNMYIRKRRYQS